MLPASRPVGRGQGTALEPSQGMASPLNSRFFGAVRHVRRGGRGAQWSGDACVAHGGQGRSGRGTGRRATQGSPPFFPATPAPTMDELTRAVCVAFL